MAKKQKIDMEYIQMLDGSGEFENTISAGRILQEKWLRPNIFVGLGSTGVNAVHRIEQRLKKIQFEMFDRPSIPECLRFIGFDTATPDANVRDSIMFQPLEIRDLDYIFDKDREVFHKLGFAEGGISIKGPAAGGKRKFGRFAFLAHADIIRHTIETGLAQSRNFPGIEGNAPARIHVITSLAGGTGCGGFLDLAFLIRAITEASGSPIEVNGYIMLPDAGVVAGAIDDRTLASAAAALKDLEYFMQMGCGGFRGMTGAPNAGDRIDYKADGSIHGLVGKPFDYCYLAGGRGRGLGSIPSIDEFEASMAESVLRNSMGDTAKWHQEKVPDNQIAKEFENDRRGKYNVFSAIGYSRCVKPTKQLEGYLALGMAKEFCDFMVNYSSTEPALYQQDEAAFHGFLQGVEMMDQVKLSGSIERKINTLPSRVASDAENGKEGKKKVMEELKKLTKFPEAIWDADKKNLTNQFAKYRAALEKRIDEHVVFDWQEAFGDDAKRLMILEKRFEAKINNMKNEFAKANDRWKTVSSKSPATYFPRGFFDKLFKQKRLIALLKGDMEGCVTALKDWILKKFNLELMGHYKAAISDRRLKIERAMANLLTIKEKWDDRLRNVSDSLATLEYGRVMDDCQTFSLFEPGQVVREASERIDNWKSTLKFDIERHIGNGSENGLDLASLYSEDESKQREFRLDVLRIAFEKMEDQMDRITESLNSKAGHGQDERLGQTIQAAGPLLMFRVTKPAVVSCYSKAFKDDPASKKTLDRQTLSPSDDAKARLIGCDLLITGEYGDNECWEATRFFHGINLADLEISRLLSEKYNAYNRRLENKRGAVKVDDEINIFDGLEHWTPPGEEAPGSKKDLTKRLWALGLCFSQIFERSAGEKKQLTAAKKKQGKPAGKSERLNYIFRVGNNYYLQPPYAENHIVASELIELGSGRLAASEQFKGTGDAIDAMKEWYKIAEENWNKQFREADLKKAIMEYIDSIIKVKQASEEIDVLQDFINDPFPEDYLEA